MKCLAATPNSVTFTVKTLDPRYTLMSVDRVSYQPRAHVDRVLPGSLYSEFADVHDLDSFLLWYTSMHFFLYFANMCVLPSTNTFVFNYYYYSIDNCCFEVPHSVYTCSSEFITVEHVLGFVYFHTAYYTSQLSKCHDLSIMWWCVKKRLVVWAVSYRRPYIFTSLFCMFHLILCIVYFYIIMFI